MKDKKSSLLRLVISTLVQLTHATLPKMSLSELTELEIILVEMLGWVKFYKEEISKKTKE